MLGKLAHVRSASIFTGFTGLGSSMPRLLKRLSNSCTRWKFGQLTLSGDDPHIFQMRSGGNPDT